MYAASAFKLQFAADALADPSAVLKVGVWF